MMTNTLTLTTIRDTQIVLDYDGEVYIEVKNVRHSLWPSLEMLKEIKTWAESRIEHAEKPLHEERDKWAFKLYNMPYVQLDFGGPRDIVDKVIAETTDLLKN